MLNEAFWLPHWQSREWSSGCPLPAQPRNLMGIFLGRELSARGGGPTCPLQILVAPCASARRGGMGSAAGAVCACRGRSPIPASHQTGSGKPDGPPGHGNAIGD